MTDIDLGTDVVRKFYKYWSAYPGNSSTSFEQLLSALKARRPMGGTAFLDGLGLGVREADLSDSRIDRAMKNLAYAAGSGKLPERNLDFWTYLSNEATKINFVDAAIYTAKESAGDALSGAKAVGDQLIFTGKILNFLLPAIILFFVFIWLNHLSGGRAMSTIKGLRK